jgi:hypothetical protein
MTKRAINAGLLVLLSASAGACFSDDASGGISISPSRVTVTAGGTPVVFTAAVPPNAGRISWVLDGVGTLAAQGDSAVIYTPPSSVSASTSAVLTATLVDSGNKSTANIEIDPPDGGLPPTGDNRLRISPASGSVYAGSAPIEFSAVLGAGAGAVTWALVGPGSISFPSPLIARYAPPSLLDADATAVLTAHLSAPLAEVSATIQVRRAVGNLVVNVGIPPGTSLSPNINITGPNGFVRALHASEMLSGLAVGSYSAVANPQVLTGPIVSTFYLPGIAGSPASITAGGTATIAVVYTARAGSGHLWVGDSGARRLRGYGGGQLASSGTVAAELGIDSQQFDFGTSAALGANGDIWVLIDPFTLGRYPSARQAAGGMPDVTLGMGTPGGFLDFAKGLAFDGSGNLWLTSNAPAGLPFGRRILKFNAAKLQVSDPNPVPDVTLRSSSSWYPTTLAFDRFGNLWAADFINDRLVKFSPGQLLIDGAPSPSTVINNVGPGSPLSQPYDIAIDGDGNLWAANSADVRPADLLMYSATQVAAGGSPNPAIRISRPALQFARGLAFDDSGGLWMGIPGGLARFSRSQLSSGGAPVPQILVQDSALILPRTLLFSPPPPSIPLYR